MSSDSDNYEENYNNFDDSASSNSYLVVGRPDDSEYGEEYPEYNIWTSKDNKEAYRSRVFKTHLSSEL